MPRVAYCAATAIYFHRNVPDQNQLVNLFKEIAIAGGLFQVIAFGAASFRVDATF